MYIERVLAKELLIQIKKKRSCLILGPRQTGKTTLIKQLKVDLYLNLSKPKLRKKYEMDPDVLEKECLALLENSSKKPIIVIDEIQKVPDLMNVIQSLVDDHQIQFILTGSSARKLKKISQTNLLPGRLISLKMSPISLNESSLLQNGEIEDILDFGSLPTILIETDPRQKGIELKSYVESYLEEEVRQEALVRSLPQFYRFLECAALESGKIVSFNKIAQDIGVAQTTITSYYSILEDCLIVDRVDPIIETHNRKKLSKSSKYLFFDLGVRRLAAKEGRNYHPTRKGDLFEHFIGNQIISYIKQNNLEASLHYWKDLDGPEVDWVLKVGSHFLPIEVKLTEGPSKEDMKHLLTFKKEYKCPNGALVVCCCSPKQKLADNIYAIHWRQLFEELGKMF